MNTNRDSFDVRIDDDLFEVIVSYLPIKDKLRYESVSKRFQRFVFNKQKILKIYCFEENYKKKQLGNELKTVFVNDFDKKVLILTILLEKFQFIDTLETDFLSEDFWDTITEYCNHLTAISISGYNIKTRSKALKRFCRKFGKQLRHISFCGYSTRDEVVFKAMFRNLPNVTTVSHILVDYLNSELSLEKLVKMDAISVTEYPQFLTNLLFDKSFNLKYLSLDFFFDADYPFKKKLSKDLKNLKNLRVLKIGGYPHSSTESDIWSKTIESIATNCRQLEYFSFDFYPPWDNQYLYEKQFIQSFANFSGLKKLSLKTPDDSLQELYHNRKLNEQITDLTPLKNCKNLLDLNLRLVVINRNVFNGIELIVPQLRQLCLESAKLEITDEVFESMAKLKYLSQIKIICKVFKRNADALRVLINGCKRLKHFAVKYRYTNNPNLKKINEVIESHPNIHFEFKRKGFDY